MNTQAIGVEQAVAAAWKALMMKGITAAITGLSGMCEQDIQVNSLTAKRIPVIDTPSLVGGSEALAAGVYLEMSGSGTGHMVIIQTPQTAYELIDMLMGEPQGTTTEFGEMEQSVLGEVGNVMGAHFLNTISDTTGLDLRVSPPAVMLDMAASILSPSIAGLMSYAEDALVLDTTFGTEDRQIHGKFLVMPNPELQDTLLTQLAS
ncbi:MAG: chemotaxis protein CheC [SAR202 cluster bacterium]|jgi:chemotaxis protein CheC|nr:chemotaxis protein CheC [SAR202 cluster bacterium]MDP6713975.1 chemotaxis protein CheC [SAR202 cluster bacterium]